MDYAESSYFDGAHFAHIAAWYDEQRVRRVDRYAREAARANKRGRPPSA